MLWQSIYNRRNNNLIWLIIGVICFCCLTYLWLNFKIASYQSTWQVPESSEKPLSRRKPTLESDEFFSGSGPSLVNLGDLLAHCLVALQLGGREVVKLSPHNAHKGAPELDTRSKGKTLEGANDLITEADYRSHVEILALLGESYPRLRVVSEENDADERNYGFKHPNGMLSVDRQQLVELLQAAKDSINISRSPMISIENTLIWIDPLDATKEYSEGLQQYVTLMACIVSGTKPIAGIIYKPFINKIYWSWSSNGHLEEQLNAIKDSRPQTKRQTHNQSPDYFYSSDLIELLSQQNTNRKQSDYNSTKNENSKQHDKEKYNIIISRSHSGNLEQVIKSSEIGNLSTIIVAGGSGYKTIELLSGRADAYVHMTHIKKWDICAPRALIHSVSDGQMTDLNGDPIQFDNPKDKVVRNGLIATTKKSVHSVMLKLL